jgi:succinyl-diaminopimelate desuccinylase
MREIIDLAHELICFKTMHSQPDEIERCVSFIEDYLKQNAIDYRRLNHNNIPSILVTRPDGSVPVLLMSHIDVVDAPDAMFKPRENGGNLYGRGSIDDKYAAALSLVLIKQHLQELRATGKGFDCLQAGLLITADEEIGGTNGAQKALAQIKTEFGIALDGGSLEKIVIKEKGIIRLKIVARGKTAHSARPWLGENAIDLLIADYQKLKKHFALSAPDHWHRTLNLSRIQAGKAANQVPDYAEALFDIRYTEADNIGDRIAAIKDELQSEVVVTTEQPVFIGGDSPYLDFLLEISPQSEVGFEHGASDARFLSDHGIKGIVWGADGDMSQHSEAEHVNIDSVYKLYHILAEFIRKTIIC